MGVYRKLPLSIQSNFDKIFPLKGVFFQRGVKALCQVTTDTAVVSDVEKLQLIKEKLVGGL